MLQMIFTSDFTKYFFLFICLLGNVLGHPIENVPYEENVMQTQESDTSDEGIYVLTTEGMLSSMWRKITNFFSADETTTFGPLTPSTNQSLDYYGRVARLARPETWRGNIHHDLRKREKANGEVLFDEGGVVAPIGNFGRSARSFKLAKELEDADPKLNEVRLKHRKKRSSFESQKSINSNYGNTFKSIMKISERFHPIIEEFDQGDLEYRRKRFKDIPSNQWVTEKIVEDTDPVENIDKENFIEEIKEDPFLLQEPSFEPIIVETEVTEEQTTVSTIKELPGIQIFD